MPFQLMDNTENMEVSCRRPEESADSGQTEIFDTEEAKDNVVESNTKESKLDDVETTTPSGTSQKEPHTEDSDAKNPGGFSNGKSDSVQTETTKPPVNDCSSESREDGKGNAVESVMHNEETSQEGKKQDPNTCDDSGAQQKEKTLKTLGTLEISNGNASNLDSQEKRESMPSSPVECNSSESSSIYSDSDGENSGSFKKESKLPSHESMQGASASVELPECNMTNTEKQKVSSHETLESVADEKATNVEGARDDLVESNSAEPELASVETTTCPETSQKDPGGDNVVGCSNLENLSSKRDNTGVPASMSPEKESKLPSHESEQGASASKELRKGPVKSTEKQYAPLDETPESVTAEKTKNAEGAQDDLKDSSTTEPELASVEATTCLEASQKGPSGDEVAEDKDRENLSTAKDDTGSPTSIPPSKEDTKGNVEKSNVHDVDTTTKEDTGVITGDKEDNNGNVEKSKVHDMETTTNGVAEKSEVTNGEKSTSTSETDPHGTISAMKNPDEKRILPPEKENSNGSSPIGSVHITEKKVELNSCDGDKSPEAFIQSQVVETTTEGTSSTSNSRDNGMVPTETGNLKTELTVSEDSAESCPVDSTGESVSCDDKGIVPEEEESTRRGSYECNLASGFLSTDPGESESTGEDFIKRTLGQLFRAVASGEGRAILLGTSTESEEEEEDEEEGSQWPYRKAGYSVVINKGKLCASSSEERAEVIMKSGTEFFILIGNDNDRAAEVDITFGGVYLGVWLVEAKRSINRPLFVQGSSWTAGRLRFFSNSDKRKPQPRADIYGEKAMLNGLIELTFKPEADTVKLFVHHVREQGSYRLIPVTVTDPMTATVADLKQDIKGRWRSNISCLLKGSQVLQEEEMISSYDLGENEVIEVVNATEELTIEAFGEDPITLTVDPNDISVEAVKEFITEQFKIPADQQLLNFKERDDVVDSKSFTHMLLTSRKTPVLVVRREEPVDANASQNRSINIGAEDARGLDTSATSCADQGSQAEDSCKANEGPNDSGDNDQDGVAMLYGDKESVYNQFQEDTMDRKFSKKRAVTLYIQLKAKSKNAATAEASGKPKPKPRPKPFEQSGARPSRPKGCTSSLYPPETPD